MKSLTCHIDDGKNKIPAFHLFFQPQKQEFELKHCAELVGYVGA
jgi:hypothetical protein